MASHTSPIAIHAHTAIHATAMTHAPRCAPVARRSRGLCLAARREAAPNILDHLIPFAVLQPDQALPEWRAAAAPKTIGHSLNPPALLGLGYAALHYRTSEWTFLNCR